MSRRGAIPMALALAFVSAAWAPVAAQTLTPTSQVRRVHVTYNQPPGPIPTEETVSAPDYGPFSAQVDGLPPLFPGPNSAAQVSTITPDSLHARGSTMAIGYDAPIESSAHVQAESFYSVSFDVSASTPFVLSGRVDLSLVGCDAGYHGRVRLTGPGGVLAYVEEHIYPFGEDLHLDPLALPVSASGVLAPGSYTLEVRTESEAFDVIYPMDQCHNATARADYDVDLLLGAPQVPALMPGPAIALAAALALCVRGAARARARR